tara:strand:+ start:8568 stop:9134 length:567 start_codon:yes stop_codon:yes gene_type:complete
MKDMGPHLLGMLVGILAAVGIVYLMLNLGKVETPPPAFADPVSKAQIEAKVSNLGLPKTWPGPERAVWANGYRPYTGETAGLIIWDSSNNERRKVFRVRPAVRKIRGEPNRQPAIVNVFMSPGDRVKVDLAPGTYEVYAISGLGWESGFDHNADVVSYGYIHVYRRRPSVIAIGAEDQPVTIVTRDWF